MAFSFFYFCELNCTLSTKATQSIPYLWLPSCVYTVIWISEKRRTSNDDV